MLSSINNIIPTWHCDSPVEVHEASNEENPAKKNTSVGVEKTYCEPNQDRDDLSEDEWNRENTKSIKGNLNGKNVEKWEDHINNVCVNNFKK